MGNFISIFKQHETVCDKTQTCEEPVFKPSYVDILRNKEKEPIDKWVTIN